MAEPRKRRVWNPRSWLTEKLVASLLVLFLLAYVVYQALVYLRAPVKTETVYEYAVSHSLSAGYVVIRSEEVVPGGAAGGVESYLYDDGERVLVGATMVEYYASESGSAERRQIQQTRQEIQMLSEAQNTAVNHLSNAEALGREIKQGLGQIVQMSSTGEYGSLGSLRPEMVSLFNKRQIATGKETGYRERIELLEGQLATMSTHSESITLDAVSAPRSGYFAHSTDGYEAELSPALLGSASIQDYLDIIDRVSGGESRAATGAARLVTDQNWHVAVTVDKYDVQWVRAGENVVLQFEEMVTPVSGTVQEVLTENYRDEAVMLIACNTVNADTVNLRSGTVTLGLSNYTGLRINTAHLRFEGEERGVYVLDNRVIRFKLIDPVYEEQGFIISRQPTNPYDTATVRQYDQIVIKGTDLYDGKIVE